VYGVKTKRFTTTPAPESQTALSRNGRATGSSDPWRVPSVDRAS
jgi:hypothetical protein